MADKDHEDVLMVDIETLATAASASLPLNEPACDPRSVVRRQGTRTDRRHRVLRLREAIESGDYRVSAPELADALLRAARQAN
jgi:hypothetical protein